MAAPPCVTDLALRLGADPAIGPATVRLSQSGRMRQGPGHRWMVFRARQSIRTAECRFDWRARAGPAGLVTVRDALAGGEGRLAAKLLGIIPVASAGGTRDAARGEAMRYLAELPWAPDAMIHNPQLRWAAPAPDRLTVSTGDATVTLRLDAEGRIASASAPDRPRAVRGGFVPTPWRGRFFDYRLEEGRWIPFRAEAGWLIGGAEAVCWEGRIEGWRITPGPAAPSPRRRRSAA